MLNSESVSGSVDPLRFLIARHRRGLKKTELARMLGVTSRTIARYEQGSIPDGALTNLAEVLGFPRQFFYREVPLADNVEPTRFRSRKRAPQSTKDIATAFGVMGAEIDIYIKERFTLPQLNLPDLSELSPELAARELRYHWAIGPKRPIPNLIQLCESKGVHVYSVPSIASHIDAFSDWYDTNPLIFLSRKKSPERARFHVAHELGHLVMHHQGSVENAAWEEKQADRFATEFLLPSSVLHQGMHKNPSIEAILQYRNSFRLSAMAVTMAARQEELLDQEAFDHRMRFLSRHGYRTQEPGGRPHHEQSRIFPTVFNRSNSKHLTVEQASQDLALPPVDVHALTFESQLIGISGAGSGSGSQTGAQSGPRSGPSIRAPIRR